MAGYVHITRTDVATGTYGRSAEEYRFIYTAGGNSWARTFDDRGLEEFLTSEVGLPPNVAGEIANRARLHGNVTVPDIALRESELPAMQLTQLPSDD